MVDGDVYEQYLKWKVEQLEESSDKDGKEIPEDEIQERIESIQEIVSR